MKKIEYVKGILVGAVFAATIAVTMLAVPSARADTDLEGTAQAKPLYTMVVNNSRDGLPFAVAKFTAETKEGATFGYPQITGTDSMRVENVKGPSGEIVQLTLY